MLLDCCSLVVVSLACTTKTTKLPNCLSQYQPFATASSRLITQSIASMEIEILQIIYCLHLAHLFGAVFHLLNRRVPYSFSENYTTNELMDRKPMVNKRSCIHRKSCFSQLGCFSILRVSHRTGGPVADYLVYMSFQCASLADTLDNRPASTSIFRFNYRDVG